MKNSIVFLGLICMLMFTTNYGYSQKASLATFQETAQVMIEKNTTQNATASIALQSTSIQEIRIPAELEQKIRENGKITSIILTNQDRCVLGVLDKSCIIINVARDPNDKDFLAIQNSTKKIANTIIDKLNQTFDTKAKFHSVFIQSSDEISKAIEASRGISSNGTVSVVYAMSMEDTGPMYEKFSSILLPKIIRDSGGFYDVAKNLSKEKKSTMTFSIIPLGNKSLLQLKLSVDYQNMTSSNEINPLEFLKVDELKRSDYFSKGFYPLNSILQVAVSSPESNNVSDVRGKIIPTQVVDGEKIPKELTSEGWIFDPEQGKIIQGKYIFGERTSINKDELIFSVGGGEVSAPKKIEKSLDESIIIVVIITAVAIAAAVFYLKGYRK